MTDDTVSEQPMRAARIIPDSAGRPLRPNDRLTAAPDSTPAGDAPWAPATDGEFDAWARGYFAGWDQGYADGCSDG
jgi:hypothetical protein